MRKELENKLFNKYPKLYQEKDLPMQQTCLCWGICCGDGWYNLLDELSAKLSEYDVYVSQVKEKFGTLRFYVSFGENITEEDRDKVYSYIDEAELKSGKTCEVCGAPGKSGGIGWIRTLCADCNQKN